MIKSLQQKQTDILEATDAHGYTCLTKSIVEGNLLAMHCLLLCGANPKTIDAKGHTPLQLAFGKKQKRSIELLLNHYVDANIQSDHGQSLLHQAIVQADAGLVALLVSHQVDVNKPDEQGKHPFQLAFEQKNKAIMEMLLKKGADPNTQDQHG